MENTNRAGAAGGERSELPCLYIYVYIYIITVKKTNGYFDQSFGCLSFTPLHMTCVMGDPTGCSTFQTVNNIFWHISDGRGGYSHDNYISASPTGCSTF